MNQPSMNPFRPTRWEHHRDGQQLIWYSQLANTLSGEKSFYISGSRGSGKTTLLRSICWEDLAKNVSLRLQKTLDQAESIGCYIRFPDHLTSSLGGIDWQRIYPDSPAPELELHRFFSLLIETTCAERAITACHELRLSNFVSLRAGEEIQFTTELLSEYPKLHKFMPNETIATLPDLSRLFRFVAREINQAASRGTVRELNERLPAREPGELLTFVTTKLSAIAKLKSSKGDRRPGFKFCLDDCEVLSTSQQVSINTLVRICKHPISWVVSYVGWQFEDSLTYIKNQTLSDADRRVESLDRRSEGSFRELCQAVVSLRLLFESSESIRTRKRLSNVSEFFDLRRRLGSRSVNDMMDSISRRSMRPLAKTLRQSAAKLQIELPAQFSRGDLSTPPFYQAYTLLHWQPNSGLSSFKTEINPNDESQLLARASLLRTNADEAWLRRKQRAALLHFSSSIGFKTIPLSGENVIVSLADGSIRDFLEILGFIYEAYAKRHHLDLTNQESLDHFAISSSQIASSIQTDGIYAASAAYYAGVGARAEKDFDVVLRLIEGLGHYTSLLQSNPDDPSVLGRAERGIFTIKFDALGLKLADDAKQRELVVWNAIRQAELSGYLRSPDKTLLQAPPSIESSSSSLVIRLHRRFSPHFRFSYRGPYELITLYASDLWTLCDRSHPVEPQSWAESMAGKATAEDQPLFSFSWPNDND
jgi:hypothetical protein